LAAFFWGLVKAPVAKEILGGYGFEMRGVAKQLDFSWASWFRPVNPPQKRFSKSLQDDPDLTAWCVEASKSLGLSELAGKVKVFWNARMQTTAGRAWWPDRSIELNPKLKSCGPEEVWRTLKHELAHLVAYERSKRRRIEPHGQEWQVACANLGIPGERSCHNLPFKRRQLKRNHAYVCANCLAVVRRVKPIKRAVACYDCCRKHNAGTYHERFRLVKHTE
jgi:SprT protein